MTAAPLPSGLSLRPALLPDDLERVVAVISAADARFPVTVDAFTAQYAPHDPALQTVMWVAETDGELVGVARAVQQDTQPPDEYRGSLWVAQPWQRRGVGRALLKQLEQGVRAAGGRVLRGMVRQDVEAALALTGHAGYRRAWTRIELSLDVTPQLVFGTDALLARLHAAGLVFASMAALGEGADRDRQLWALDRRVRPDIPTGGLPLPQLPLEVWTRRQLGGPSFQPALSFAALDPARQDPHTGSLVGFTTLHHEAGGWYEIGMTGTLPGYRGRGLARALKVLAMQALQRQGGGLIRTYNDAPNTAMLKVNQDLGFGRGPELYRYEREL